MKKVIVVILVFVIALLGVACSAETDVAPTPSKVIIIEPSGLDKAKNFFAEITGQTCASQSEEFLVEIQDINMRWLDAMELADSTSRMSLSGPISDLQLIRRDANKLEPPECAEGAKDALVMHMDYVLDGFLLFMAQEPDEDISAQFSEAWDWMDIYLTKLSTIEKS